MNIDVHGKAALYFIIALLSVFADRIGDILFKGEWPSLPVLAGCMLFGLIAACTALRAFYDGSYERAKNGNGTKEGPDNYVRKPME